MAPRTALVTGAAAGIGLATAQQLLAAGMQVVVVARSRHTAEAAVQLLRQNTEHRHLVLSAHHGDLLHRRARQDLVAALAAGGQQIDVLVNNAGAAFDSFQETEDGAERTHALNHLAPFELTHRLLAAGVLAPGARIVNLVSDLEKKGTVDPAAPDVTGATWRARFSQTPVYGTSKLLNLLATRELARRLPPGTTAYSAVPGVARTGFMTNAGGAMARMSRLAAPFLSSPEKAARTTVLLATSTPALTPSGGVFAKGHRTTPSSTAQDDRLAAAVYAETAAALGVEPLRPAQHRTGPR